VSKWFPVDEAGAVRVRLLAEWSIGHARTHFVQGATLEIQHVPSTIPLQFP